MPLKHTEPQKNPQHSTATAEPGYAVTHTLGISESSDLPADAITASSRVQSYLRDKRSWMNVIVVAHMQLFCCVLSVAFVNSYGWIPVISAVCSTTALYFRYRFPYGSIYVVIAALCLTFLSPFPDSLALTCYPPVSLAAYHTGRHWTRHARFRALILGWVGALAVTVQASLSLLYHWDDVPARIFISLMLGVLCGSIFTVFWFLGDSRRMRELRSEEFEERARRLEYEQEQERRLAAQDERTIPHGLAHGVRQVVLFGLVGRGRLSRRAGQEDRVAAFVDQLGREALRGDQVNVAGGRHGGDHRGREGSEAARRNVRHVPHLTHPGLPGPPPASSRASTMRQSHHRALPRGPLVALRPPHVLGLAADRANRPRGGESSGGIEALALLVIRADPHVQHAAGQVRDGCQEARGVSGAPEVRVYDKLVHLGRPLAPLPPPATPPTFR